MSKSYDRARMMKCPQFFVGQPVSLNEDVSEHQAKGYGLACDDPRVLVELGKAYEVSGIDVRRFATAIYLVGVEGRFNSVCFHAVP